MSREELLDLVLRHERLFHPQLSKRVAIVSVEHTGTHTLQALIPTVQVFHTHVRSLDDNHTDDLGWWQAMAKRTITFSPLRDPKTVWRSWCKRMPTTFNQKTYQGKIDTFLFQWDQLEGIEKILKPFFVPIDQIHNSQRLVLGATHKDPEIVAKRVAQYPWQPRMDRVYDIPFIKERYALSP